MNETLTQIAYLVATALFIFSLKWMNDPQSARRGVLAGVAAMLMAVGGTLLSPGIIASNIYAYDGLYLPTDSVRPMKGYWVKASQEGSLKLTLSAPVLSLEAEKAIS